MEVRELHLYSPKVDGKDMTGLFNLIVRSRFPFLGFLSFADIFSPNALELVLRRRENTINLYIRDKPCLRNLSALIFPFRLCDTSLLKPARGSYFPLPRLFFLFGARADAVDFVLKEGVEELSIGISKVFGRFLGIGSMADAEGRKGMVFISSPHEFFRLDLEKNPSIYMELLEPLPKKVHMSSGYPIFEETGMSVGADNFDPLQHSLIVGTSGAGKSKALFVMLKAIGARFRNGTRSIIIDPHGEFAKIMPQAKVIDFRGSYVEPLDVGGDKSPMLTQLIAQLITSTIGQDNKYSERVLFYAVHLLTSLDSLELGNISLLLTDTSKRAEFVSQCDNAEVKRFFDEEFNDIYIHHFNSAVLPILNFIGEYQLYLGKERKRVGLVEALNSHRTVVISFDPHYFGRRMISFLAGAIINQMYILAITGKLMDKPTILVVDEFPRVETRVTRDILSETRKFNLYAYLSCQYLGQLSKEVLDGIVSNVRNIVAFKLNRQDAAMLSSIMEIKVEEYFKKSRAPTELDESKKEMFVRLHQRECIVRLFDGEKYLLPMKLRVVDAKRWGLGQGGMAFPDEDEPEDSGAGAGGMKAGGEEPQKPILPNPIAEERQERSSTPPRRKDGAVAFGGKGIPDAVARPTPPPMPPALARRDKCDGGAFTISVDGENAVIRREKRKLRKDELGL